jgi:predicted MFS family arabinose efflux permease
LISLAVRFAGHAPTLGSALTVSAFNCGTAVGSWIAGLTLDSSLGDTGPAVVGATIAALTLIPTTAIVITERRRHSEVRPARTALLDGGRSTAGRPGG